MTRGSQAAISVVRADAVRHYCRHFDSMGAPLAGLLERAAIPAEILDIPNAVIPLRNAFHLAELACSKLSSEHLGLYIGLASSLDDFGLYGRSLQSTCTIGAYLQRGIACFNAVNSGERLWSSVHGSELRLNITSTENLELGAYQSHLCTLVVTLGALKSAAGPDWSPREIGLAYKSREPLPSTELFDNTKVFQGLGHSYITLPLTLLDLRLQPSAGSGSSRREELATALPTDFIAIVITQMEALSAFNQHMDIDMVAESLGMSRRTLQRAIGIRGITYLELLNEYRMRRAVEWLDRGDRLITDIAIELGYSDASNFTRAFRRYTGLSPRAFREEKLSH